MKFRSHHALLALACALTLTAAAQPTPKATLLALSKQDHTLAIVDPATLHVLATVPVGDDPHEVIASADGKTAYVSNYGFGAFHTLAVIDLVGQMRLPSIDLGALRGPHGLTFEQGKVWFTAEAAKAIGSYDPATQKIDWIMGIGQDRTHMIYVFPGAQRILTTNVNSATVTILNHTEGRPGGPPPGMQAGGPPPGPPPTPPGGNWELTNIPVGRGSEGFDVSPNGKEAWVANAQDGTVSVIDIAAKKVVATLQTSTRGANRLKFTPDGKYVFMTPGSALVILDAATRKEVKRLTNVHGSGGIQMQPDGARAYVACGRDNYVAVIDLKTLELVGKIDIASPDGLAWAIRH
ncbi:MAG TPA: cytochrome D1 domain-containing protein [Terracidiphilus sp.]|nr:cytochrome D1 domain-containing protein [Terracidiphilus sp.]